jgi:hypothetical protein
MDLFDRIYELDRILPFTYLGPADLNHHESERPIKVVWRLRHPMPAERLNLGVPENAIAFWHMA